MTFNNWPADESVVPADETLAGLLAFTPKRLPADAKSAAPGVPARLVATRVPLRQAVRRRLRQPLHPDGGRSARRRDAACARHHARGLPRRGPRRRRGRGGRSPCQLRGVAGGRGRHLHGGPRVPQRRAAAPRRTDVARRLERAARARGVSRSRSLHAGRRPRLLRTRARRASASRTVGPRTTAAIEAAAATATDAGRAARTAAEDRAGRAVGRNRLALSCVSFGP